MKKDFILTLIIFMSSFLVNAQTKVWANDSVNSHLGFKISHLTFSKVKGHFVDFNVKVITTKSDYSDAKVVLTAKVASIHTNSSSRDDFLRSDNFFDADKYPLLIFESTSVKDINTKKGFLFGNLSMHGVTKPITLKVEYLGSVMDSTSKKEIASFNINGTLKRSDYSIGSKYPRAICGKKVTIIGNIEFSPGK